MFSPCVRKRGFAPWLGPKPLFGVPGHQAPFPSRCSACPTFCWRAWFPYHFSFYCALFPACACPFSKVRHRIPALNLDCFSYDTPVWHSCLFRNAQKLHSCSPALIWSGISTVGQLLVWPNGAKLEIGVSRVIRHRVPNTHAPEAAVEVKENISDRVCCRCC